MPIQAQLIEEIAREVVARLASSCSSQSHPRAGAQARPLRAMASLPPWTKP